MEYLTSTSLFFSKLKCRSVLPGAGDCVVPGAAQLLSGTPSCVGRWHPDSEILPPLVFMGMLVVEVARKCAVHSYPEQLIH